MEDVGADVHVRAGRVGEGEALEILATARCVVVPYPRHYGMSRVLVEAAVAGTPVVAHRFGLVGYLVERHGLGLSADCTSPVEFAGALARLTGDETAPGRYADALARFAGRYTPGRFRAAVATIFRNASSRSSQAR